MQRLASALLLVLWLASLAAAQESRPGGGGSNVPRGWSTQAHQDFQRGLAEARSGQDDLATADFHASIALDSNHIEAFEALAAMLAKRGQWRTIVQYWAVYIQRHPEDGRAYCERGTAYSWLQDDNHALADADKACSLSIQHCCQEAKNYRAHPAPWALSPMPAAASGSGEGSQAAPGSIAPLSGSTDGSTGSGTSTSTPSREAGPARVTPNQTGAFLRSGTAMIPFSLTIETTPNPSVAGQPVTVSFKVAPLAGQAAGPTPTGTVVARTSESTCEASVEEGHCSLVIHNASDTLLAEYKGDRKFIVIPMIVRHTVTDFDISASLGFSIEAGSKESYEIRIRPVNGFRGAVSLSCATSPALAKCSFSPQSVTLGGSDSASSTLRVQTSDKADYKLSVTITGISGSGNPRTGGLTHRAQSDLSVLHFYASSHDRADDLPESVVVIYVVLLALGALIGFVVFLAGFGIFGDLRAVENTPETPIAGVAMGLVHICGQAVGDERLTSPVTSTPCFGYRVDVKIGPLAPFQTYTKTANFYLQDASGTVLVNPDGAQLDLAGGGTAERVVKTKEKSSRAGEPSDQELRMWAFRHFGDSNNHTALFEHLMFREYCILPGQRLNVAGTCVENPQSKDAQDHNMIARGTPFVISCGTEERVEGWLRWRAALSLIAGAAITIICVGLLILFVEGVKGV